MNKPSLRVCDDDENFACVDTSVDTMNYKSFQCNTPVIPHASINTVFKFSGIMKLPYKVKAST